MHFYRVDFIDTFCFIAAEQKALILDAMSEITAKTVVRGSRCVYFAPRTTQDDFLDIKPDVG